MGPQEQSFDWRGFLFASKFCSAIIVVGIALHYGTLYAAAMLLPEPALVQSLPQAKAAPLEALDPSPESLMWEQVTGSAPWAPRDSAASFVFKDRMWTMGGLNGNGIEAGPEHSVKYWLAPYFNDIWSTQDGKNWAEERAAADWAPRRSMTVTEFKGRLWMLGGWTPKEGYLKDVWTSDDAVHWRKAAEAPWPGREGHTLEVWQGRLWLIGGVNYDERKTLNDVWYSDDGVNWSQAPDAPWPTRWDHATAIFEGRIFMAGGMDLKKNTFADVWSTKDGVNWEQMSAHAPWLSRQGHQLVPYKDTMYIIGRLNDDTTTGPNDLWFTHDGTTWQKTAQDPPWIGREDHAALLFKDRLWVFGGMDADWHWQSDVWRSSLLSAQTTSVSTQPEAPALSAAAALVVSVSPGGKSTTVFASRENDALPIASMTKLMTALVASEMFKPDEQITTVGAALEGKGLSGIYIEGDTFALKDALAALLVASHNEIATALAQKAGTDAFVARMNGKAAELGMARTHFANPSGLDPDAEREPNLSSAADIAKLLRYIYEREPALFALMSLEEYQLNTASGAPKAVLHSTDKLLGDAQSPLRIMGGKTGETPRARQNLSVVAQAPDGTIVISVVVGSQDSFGDTRMLLEYAKGSR